MADKSVRLEVRGIRELQGAFRKLDDGSEKALREAFKGIAESVASLARTKAGGGNAASSIRPKGSNRGASIAFGGAKAPYYPFLDFGGSVGRGHQAGRAWSGAIKREWKGQPSGSGRYVYPAISEKRDETADAVDDALTRLAKSAGFETRGGN